MTPTARPRSARRGLHQGPRRAGAAGCLAFLAALAADGGCKSTPTIGLEMSLPSDVASKVAWFEAGVFSGSQCTILNGELAGGIPAEGYVARIAWASSDPAPPILSDLPRAQYSVAATARAADCSIVATGCADVDLSSAGSVTVTMNDVSGTPQGACASGDVCNDARCTPATNSGNTGVGAGCSLELLGAGPLADPLLIAGGGVTSAPAIAATSTGFLVAYREYDGTDGLSRITVLPIDQGGGALVPQQTQQAACSETQTSDATGIAFSGSSGVVADARAACGTTGGIDLFALGGGGVIGSDGFATLGQVPVQLSTAHALAESTAGTFLAYTQGGTASLASVGAGALGTPAPFAGGFVATDAWVAASDDVVAMVSVGQGTQGTGGEDAALPASDDAGADDGSIEAASDDAGATEDAAPVTPVGPSPSQVHVAVVSVDDGGSPFGAGAPYSFAGTWASVSAQQGRVFVASDGQTADAPVAYQAFDVGQAAPSVSSGFGAPDAGPVLYADVAYHQDHVFFAVEQQGSITLVAFDNASTTPTLLRTVDLGADLRIPSLVDVRDGRVAVLATDSRVVVAWTTQEVLDANDAAGGYAVFACTTP